MLKILHRFIGKIDRCGYNIKLLFCEQVTNLKFYTDKDEYYAELKANFEGHGKNEVDFYEALSDYETLFGIKKAQIYMLRNYDDSIIFTDADANSIIRFFRCMELLYRVGEMRPQTLYSRKMEIIERELSQNRLTERISKDGHEYLVYIGRYTAMLDMYCGEIVYTDENEIAQIFGD